MTARIWRAICLVAAGALLVTVAVITLFLYDDAGERCRQQLKSQLLLAAAGVEQGGAAYLRSLDSGGADYRLTWVEKNGMVLYDSEARMPLGENHADRQEIKQAMREGSGESVRYSETLTESNIYIARRLADGSVLRISTNRRTILAVTLSMLQPVFIVFALVVIAAMAVAHRMARDILSPVNALDPSRPPGQAVYEELAPLVRRLDEQRKQINRQLNELAEKNQALEKAAVARREFTANVSHELKTPIHTIMGSAELLEQGLVKAGDIPGFVGRIRAEAARLVQLIEDIIQLSKLDEGNAGERRRLEILPLAKEAANSLRPVAEEQRIELSVTGSGGAICGAGSMVTQVLSNLLENAIKYNHPGGTVTADVSTVGSEVVVKVADTGIGIPAEFMPRIFERFYRVDKSHSKEIGGTGLGLSIVKHAVEYHNGTVEINSEAGRGTTVVVRFPRAAAE